MSIPFYIVAPTTATVVKPAFTAEKQHMILAVKNDLIPTSLPFLEFTSATDYALSFGQDETYQALVKYFGFLSKSGTAPEKAVIFRWYNEDTAPFAVGSNLPETALSSLKVVTDGSIKVTLNGTSYDVTGLDFSAQTSLSGIASVIQEGIRKNESGGTAFTSAIVTYSSITGGFVITGGEAGKTASIGAFSDTASGTSILSAAGLENAVLSQGVSSETFADLFNRIMDANPAGFSITTAEIVTEQDMETTAALLQQIVEEQTLYTNKKLVFNFSDLAALNTFSAFVKNNSYTGITLTYDPNGENVNVLDCAITASTDYEAENGTKNYNFQPAVGYTSVTDYGTVTEYQDGQTNLGTYNALNAACACFVYSIGYGTQKQTFYGTGVMLGSFGTEDVQANQAGLESYLQLAVVNGLAAVEKLKLQGTDAVNALSGVVDPAFKQFQKNGAIAYNGSLSDTDKLTIVQNFGSSDVADAVEQNGYYFVVEDLTAEDIAARKRRIRYAYIAGGVVNKVVFNAAIYGA